MKRKLLLICVLILFSCVYLKHQYSVARDNKKTEQPPQAASDVSTTDASGTDTTISLGKPLPPDTLVSLPSSIGTLTYYSQKDARWADSIYGGTDSISVYGCGPTVLAMLVSSFTDYDITPDTAAQWAYEHHYWSSGSGSSHNLIPEGVSAFGLSAESLRDHTADGIKTALKEGKILVALMGAGHFTDSGHFIIIADYYSDNLVSIADPASPENTKKPWDIDLILNELNAVTTFGGPVWAVKPI